MKVNNPNSKDSHTAYWPLQGGAEDIYAKIVVMAKTIEVKDTQLEVVTHTCNASIREAEVEE